MSDSSLDPENHPEAQASEGAAHCGAEEVFVPWPLTLLERAVRQAEKYSYEYEQNGSRPNLIKRLFFRLLSYRLTWIIGIGLAAILFCWYLVSIQFLDTNQSQVFFAGILTLATIATWIAMHVQNNIMVKQMGQTDAMIGHMRLDQRAWICVGDVKLGERVLGNAVHGYVKFTNTGKTPARLIDTLVHVNHLPKGQTPYPFRVTDAEMEGESSTCAIPPQGEQFLHDAMPHTPTDEYEVIVTEESVIWISGWIYYRDVIENKLRRTTFCLAYDPHINHMVYSERGNEMT
jgi:hypothetical protein